MADVSNTGTAPAPQSGAARGGFDLKRMTSMLRRGEILLALGLIAVLTVLILPMPAWLLDISLALSITISVLVLMVVLLIERPLDFSTFPTVLLIVTMLR